MRDDNPGDHDAAWLVALGMLLLACHGVLIWFFAWRALDWLVSSGREARLW